MLVPHGKLTRRSLRAIVEEFVTRDGTDYSSVEERIELVLQQLESQQVELHFSHQSQTTNIVRIDSNDAGCKTLDPG